MRENSIGILISQADGKIIGTLGPMELDKNEEVENVIMGHIVKANPQSKNLKKGNYLKPYLQSK